MENAIASGDVILVSGSFGVNPADGTAYTRKARFVGTSEKPASKVPCDFVDWFRSNPDTVPDWYNCNGTAT